MEKNELEFIKLLDGIEDEMIEEAGKDWRQKKTFWQTSTAKAACAALVVLAGTLSTFHPTVKAAIQEYTLKLESLLGIESDLADYKDLIHSSQTEKGVTMNLDEIILSDEKMYLSVSVDSEKEIEGIRVDNIELKSESEGEAVQGFISAFDSDKVLQQNQNNVGEKGSKQQYVIEYLIEKEAALPENMEIAMEVDAVLANNSEQVPFTFNCRADKGDLDKDTRKGSFNGEIRFGDSLKITSLDASVNRVFSCIRAKGDINLDWDNNEYFLKGKDSQGNEVRYYPSFSDKESMIFLNEDGIVPDKDCSYLELQLYVVELAAGEGKTVEDNSVEMAYEHLADAQENIADADWFDSDDAKPVGDKFKIEFGGNSNQ